MIVFHNPGLIETDAFRLMGASVKKEGSFGRFGTGLKYAVATILRTGGKIEVLSGDRRYRFETHPTTLKEQAFNEVVLVRDERGPSDRIFLGFTTQLGKDWEPWMAVRELGCNARDEGGGFFVMADWETMRPALGEEQTEIILSWPEVEEKWDEVLAQTFASGEQLYEGEGVRVLAGKSDFLYHRGVRVMKLSKPSVFAYDVVSSLALTEDRTVKYSFIANAAVRNMLLTATDAGIIAGALTTSKDQWEGNFDWKGEQWEPRDPGPTWMEEAARLRQRDNLPNKSANAVLLAHSAYKTAVRYSGGGYYQEPMDGAFNDVVDQLGGMGVEIKDINMFIAPELPEGMRSTVRNGSIYVDRSLVDEDQWSSEVAKELLTRWLELKSGGDYETLLALIVPLLLDTNYDFKRERERLAELEGVE